MQFCKDCGGVLNLFGINKGDLCSACIQHQKGKPPPPTGNRQESGSELLAEAVLSLEGGKMVLRSKEGWELWSTQSAGPTVLATVLARARRIYEIRLRRQKN